METEFPGWADYLVREPAWINKVNNDSCRHPLSTFHSTINMCTSHAHIPLRTCWLTHENKYVYKCTFNTNTHTHTHISKSKITEDLSKQDDEWRHWRH